MSRVRWLGLGGAAIALAGVLGATLLPRSRAAETNTASSTASEARQFWTAYNEASKQRAAGDMDAAVLAYAAALQLRPAHEDSLYYLGHCHLARGDRAMAIKAWEQLVEVNPEGSSRGYMQLGLAHAPLEPAAPVDLAIAARYFRRALDVDPDSGALLGLGEVALLRGDWREAAEALGRANDDNAMSLAAPYLLGYLAFRRGDQAAAWSFFQTAVSRAEVKKPAVKWTEEGDLKADPALRWRALARQSVFGAHWLRVRDYLVPPGPSAAVMRREYRQLSRALEAFDRRHAGR